MILIAMCVGMTTYSFINNHFTTIARTTVQNINSTVKTGNLNTILTGVQIDSGTKLSTTTKTIKTTKTRPSQTTTTEWTKPLLGQVSAWYEWETTYERVRNQIIKLGVSYEIAEHITWEAYTNTEDPKQFVRAIIWVSNAEWGIFDHWMYNNYLWVMLNGSLRHYKTVQAWITHWRELYNKNKWYLNTDWQDWLDRHYCVGGCSSWIWNYNAGIYLLNI